MISLLVVPWGKLTDMPSVQYHENYDLDSIDSVEEPNYGTGTYTFLRVPIDKAQKKEESLLGI